MPLQPALGLLLLMGLNLIWRGQPLFGPVIIYVLLVLLPMLVLLLLYLALS